MNDETRTREEAGEREEQLLVRRLAALPREIVPGRDLWPGIEARLSGQAGRRVRPSRWIWRAAVLAAAVLALAALALTLPWLRPGTPPQTRASAPRSGDSTLAWEARLDDGTFVTRQALEGALETAKVTGSLPPEAEVGLETGMRALDRAIGEIRAALDHDPDNARLRLLLAQRYQQEARLLYRVQLM